MSVRTLTMAAVGVVVLAAPSFADGPPGDKRFEVKVEIKRGDPAGGVKAGTVELLGRPTLVVQEGMMGSVTLGQTVVVGGKSVDVGHRTRVVARPAPGGKVRVRLWVEVTEVVGRGVQAERDTWLREVGAGETVRLKLAERGKKLTWVELRAQEVKD